MAEFRFDGNIKDKKITAASATTSTDSTRSYEPFDASFNRKKSFDSVNNKTIVRIVFIRALRLAQDSMKYLDDDDDEITNLTDTSDFTFTFEIEGDTDPASSGSIDITNDDFDPCNL